MFGRKPLLDGVSMRDLLITIGIALLGLIGLLPRMFASEWRNAPLDLLAWFALSAPATGCIGGRIGLRFWPLGFVPPGLWMAFYSLIAANEVYGSPTPVYAALVWTGLFAFGWAFGIHFAKFGWGGPGLLLILTAFLTQSLELIPSDSHSQEFIAFAIDLSPLTWVMECAGLDWMRNEMIYDYAGSLGPDARTPFRGMLAGPLTFLVGWSLVMIVERRSRPRANTERTIDSAVGS